MNQEETISFSYHGERVNWTYKELDTSRFAPQYSDLRALVKCDHPIFIRIAQGHHLLISSLSYLLEKGRVINSEFFDAMARSFMDRPYAIG
jgi:hypothetical protein